LKQSDLEDFLKPLNASIADRQRGKKFIEQNPDYFEALLSLALNPKAERVHIVASWVLEQVLFENISRLKTHWTYFLKQLSKIENESMRRPLSKILFAYVKNNELRIQLSKREEERILELCFDWIIAPAQTATLAFALKTLTYYIHTHDWIREALEDLIQKGFGKDRVGIQSTIKRLLTN